MAEAGVAGRAAHLLLSMFFLIARARPTIDHEEPATTGEGHGFAHLGAPLATDVFVVRETLVASNVGFKKSGSWVGALFAMRRSPVRWFTR
jgi:hypothetical protein